MKYILWTLLALCVLLGGGALYAYSLLDMQEIRTSIAEISKANTGKTLLLDEAPVLSFRPLGLRLGRATWGFENGQPAKQGLSASISGGTASIALLPLLHGTLTIEKLTLEQPHISLHPEASKEKSEKNSLRPASANLAQPAQPSASPQAAPSQALLSPQPSSFVRNVIIQTLQIEQGAVHWNDAAGKTIDAEAITLDIHNIALDQEASFTLHSTLRAYHGKQAQLAAQGFFSPAKAALSLREVHSSLKPQAGLNDFGELAFTLDGKLTLPVGKSLNVEGTVREGSAAWRTIPFTFTAALRGQNNIYTLSPLQIQLQTGGEIKAQLGADLNTFRYTATITANNVTLYPVCTAFDKRLAVQGVGAGSFDGSSAGTDEKALRKNLNGKGKIDLNDIVLGQDMLPSQLFGARIPNRFSSLQSPVVVTSGIVNANPVVLKAPGLMGKAQALLDLPKEYCRAKGTLSWSGLSIPIQAIGPFGAVVVRVDPNFSRYLLKQGLQGLLGQ